jgi:hypothetical protein
MPGVSRGPESRTEMSTPPASVRSVLTSSSRGPSLVPVIASIALMIKFRTTCCSSTRSPETGGKVSTSFVCTETPFFSASVRMPPPRPLFHEIAGALDESCRPSPVPEDATQRLPDLIHIRLIQPVQSCVGVCDHSGDGLHHVMDDGGGEIADRRNSVDVRLFRVCFAVLQLPLARLSLGAYRRIEKQGRLLSPRSQQNARKHVPKRAFAVATGEYSRHSRFSCALSGQIR